MSMPLIPREYFAVRGALVDAIAATLRLETPDPFMNAAAGALSIAAHLAPFSIC